MKDRRREDGDLLDALRSVLHKVIETLDDEGVIDRFRARDLHRELNDAFGDCPGVVGWDTFRRFRIRRQGRRPGSRK